MTLTHQIVLIVSVNALFMAAPCGAAQPPIKIGTSMSTTGANAALGQNQLRGYQLCVKHANDKGGVLGRKIVRCGYPILFRCGQSRVADSVREASNR